MKIQENYLLALLTFSELRSGHQKEVYMKWKTLSKKLISKGRIFDYMSVERQSSQSQKIGNFDLLSFNDWVNIIAITKDNKFVLVKQFRHGVDEFTLEIP